MPTDQLGSVESVEPIIPKQIHHNPPPVVEPPKVNNSEKILGLTQKNFKRSKSKLINKNWFTKRPEAKPLNSDLEDILP